MCECGRVRYCDNQPKDQGDCVGKPSCPSLRHLDVVATKPSCSATSHIIAAGTSNESASKPKAVRASERRRKLKIPIERPAERIKHSIAAIASLPGHGINVSRQATVEASQALSDVSKDSVRAVGTMAICWDVCRVLNSLCKTFAASLTDLLSPTPNRIEEHG